LPLMFFTIATVCQLRTAGVWTWFLWSSWHTSHSLSFWYLLSSDLSRVSY
jgi:hypothetical protein